MLCIFLLNNEKLKLMLLNLHLRYMISPFFFIEIGEV